MLPILGGVAWRQLSRDPVLVVPEASGDRQACPVPMGRSTRRTAPDGALTRTRSQFGAALTAPSRARTHETWMAMPDFPDTAQVEQQLSEELLKLHLRVLRQGSQRLARLHPR